MAHRRIQLVQFYGGELRHSSSTEAVPDFRNPFMG
jgi:hypothetical protein